MHSGKKATCMSDAPEPHQPLVSFCDFVFTISVCLSRVLRRSWCKGGVTGLEPDTTPTPPHLSPYVCLLGASLSICAARNKNVGHNSHFRYLNSKHPAAATTSRTACGSCHRSRSTAGTFECDERRKTDRNDWLTWGGAPCGPVTSTALARPSSPISSRNSTVSPSRRLRNPSHAMLLCSTIEASPSDYWGQFTTSVLREELIRA